MIWHMVYDMSEGRAAGLEVVACMQVHGKDGSWGAAQRGVAGG